MKKLFCITAILFSCAAYVSAQQVITLQPKQAGGHIELSGFYKTGGHAIDSLTASFLVQSVTTGDYWNTGLQTLRSEKGCVSHTLRLAPGTYEINLFMVSKNDEITVNNGDNIILVVTGTETAQN